MSRKVAFRQCDVARALKAAKMAGAARVIVRRDGSLAIELIGEEQQPQPEPDHEPLGRGKDIVL